MRFHNLDLNLLIVLDRMLADGSVSQVAQQLNMTQPAVSNTLARLRRHFEDDLFFLAGRRMIPTPFAESLRESIREAVDGLAAIATTRATFQAAVTERTFTVVTSDQAYLAVLAPAIRRLARIAPGLRIRALLTSDERAEQLGRGMADFALHPHIQLIEGHPHRRLFEDQLVGVVWSGSSRLSDPPTLEEICAIGHVEATVRTGPRFIDMALADLGLSRRIAAFAPTFALVAETVVGTDYIGWMGARPAAIVARQLQIRIVDAPFAIPSLKLLLQWHTSRDGDPGIVWMRDFLIQTAAQPDQFGEYAASPMRISS